MQFIFYLYRVYQTITDSQELTKAMKEVAEELEDHLVNSEKMTEIFDEKTEFKMRKICKDLKEKSSICPFDLFPINREAFLSMTATALTYIVVLIQFKTSELPLLRNFRSDQ